MRNLGGADIVVKIANRVITLTEASPECDLGRFFTANSVLESDSLREAIYQNYVTVYNGVYDLSRVPVI